MKTVRAADVRKLPMYTRVYVVDTASGKRRVCSVVLLGKYKALQWKLNAGEVAYAPITDIPGQEFLVED